MQTQFATAFATAFATLDRGANMVTLLAMRTALAQYSRPEFDCELQVLRAARLYTCDSSDGRHARLTAAEREAGIEEAGNTLVYVGRRV